MKKSEGEDKTENDTQKKKKMKTNNKYKIWE